MSFYREWKDRFVEFCLYRYLMDMAQNKERVAENYFSCKGRGRFHVIRQLFFAIKKHRHVFKTDIKSYFASIDTVK